MEQNPTTDAAILNVQNDTNLPQQHAPDQPLKKKKKRSTKNIIGVAIFIMRRRSSKSKRLAVHGGSGSIGDKVLGSMRPLHLESNQSPPPSLIQFDDNNKAPQLLALPLPDHGGEEALFTAIQSPATASSLEDSNNYSSAAGLSELDQSDNGEKITCSEDSDGDEMIDAKAEEFIAQFYAQMRQQRMDHMERRQKATSH